MSTVSTKPYLIRAIWEWCVDQGYTPYLATLVDAQTRVPPGYARDGQVVLNVGPDATHQLQMENDVISFQARFNGVPHSLLIPVANVTNDLKWAAAEDERARHGFRARAG